MKKYKGLAVIVTFCAAPLAAACGNGTGPVDSGFEEIPALAIMVNVEQAMFSNGVRSASGRYDTVYYHADSTVVRGVEVDLFGPNGLLTGSLTADSGMIEEETQRMVARGSVRLRTAEGDRTIETEEMHYDPTTRSLWSDVPVCMVEGDRVSRGARFRSDDEFHRIEIDELTTSTGTSC